MSVSREQFWCGVGIWTKKPHLVNRRLCGAMTLRRWRLSSSTTTLDDVLASGVERWNSPEPPVPADEIDEGLLSSSLSEPAEDGRIMVLVQRLLPRGSSYGEALRLVALDIKNDVAAYKSVAGDDASSSDKRCPAPSFCYRIRLDEERGIDIQVSDENSGDSSFEWLRSTLVPRLRKWALSFDDPAQTSAGSLNLVALDRYNELYQRLKVKYGEGIVKIWPESTDPQKFVYEDVAIATYLLLLWEREREELALEAKQSFVDAGCGNGLLVYILNGEGHPGSGVDVRRRKIWDAYPASVRLEVGAIEPSAYDPRADWIIGNHSDELTPWIPVFAARSSYEGRFFLLPCCAYDFGGDRYRRRDSSRSQYGEYLEYLREICDECGVETLVDRLKIPSTKRTCLVGTARRHYSKIDHPDWMQKLKKYVEGREGSTVRDEPPHPVINEPSGEWTSNFKPREAIEKVRNCTKIERSVVDRIVDSVAGKLLETLNKDSPVKGWNEGSRCPIPEVVDCVPRDLIKELKSECGGLQTLLKNNYHVFEVQSGTVKLRRPISKCDYESASKAKKRKYSKPVKGTFKARACWFFKNHPDGCPLTSDACRFSHDP